MRTLVLLRHSKAGPHVGDDHARRLSDRGREDAASARRWLGEQGIAPDRVVVSTSTRTRETWELASVGHAVPEYDDRIYEASVADLREVVQETGPDVATVLLVGHNPSIERFAWELDESDVARDSTNRGMRTSGLAVFELSSWTDSLGTLLAFEA